ncbi:hypothetical protein AJ80_01379 [Polytolypa hystricis UAMH7299]|uniref:DUF985 domain-containing protein n=1 Tax=Polytolypa hystricis (strain UAMH7299) TaxID=1447883 RepID=A0A2B7Z074_POLH7|nr:hypothetical protein AJ80_01379 [Polytolypa hystricis UAMH7299]
MDIPLSQIKPIYLLQPAGCCSSPPSSSEPPLIQQTIDTLKLQKHMEGGYFVETDRDPLRVPNPFFTSHTYELSDGTKNLQKEEEEESADNSTRSASTSIFYLLTPGSPMGAFHRNKGRTVHTLHRGRGRYVIIHADEVEEENGGRTKKARVESFVVGQNIQAGERLQWIVEGGKYKSSYLLPDEREEGESEGGLLISETVVPGFEYLDHDFMLPEELEELVTPEHARTLSWMLRKPDSG